MLLLAPVFIKDARITKGTLKVSSLALVGCRPILPRAIIDYWWYQFTAPLPLWLQRCVSLLHYYYLIEREVSIHLFVARNVLCMASIQLMLIAFLTSPIVSVKPTASSVLPVYLEQMCRCCLLSLYDEHTNAGQYLLQWRTILYLLCVHRVLLKWSLFTPTTWLALVIIYQHCLSIKS